MENIVSFYRKNATLLSYFSRSSILFSAAYISFIVVYSHGMETQ